MGQCRGITPRKLIWVLAVGATLGSVAVSVLRDLVLDSRRTARINTFVAAIQVFQNKVAKRSPPRSSVQNGRRRMPVVH